MAIIRGGKRIGIFDIRAGISREDLKGVYNVANDPRLKQKANSETTIGRFRSAIARGEGMARPSRFAIDLQLPQGVSSQALENQSNGRRLSPTRDDLTTLTNDAKYIRLMCSNISFPGRNLSTTVRNTHGISQEIVDGVTYGELVASFYCDKFMREKQVFEYWQKTAYNPVSYNVNYSDEYTAPLIIYQLGSFSSQNDRDRATYAIELVEAFPKTIDAQELSYEANSQVHKINITFSFKFWRNLVTDSGDQYGLSFADKTTGVVTGGGGFQLPAAIRNIPILGNIAQGLSTDMLRTVRDTSNRVFNQIPVGKIFGGKVFPPF